MNLKPSLLSFVFLASSCTLWYEINPKVEPSNLSQLEASLRLKEIKSTEEIEERAQFIRDSLVTDFALSLWKLASELSGDKELIDELDLHHAFQKETQTVIVESKEQVRLERQNKIVSFSNQDKIQFAQKRYSAKILYEILKLNSSSLKKKKEFNSSALVSFQNYLDTYATLLTNKAREYSSYEGRKKIYARHIRLASEDFFDIPHITKRESLAFYSASAFERSLHYLNLRLSESKQINFSDLSVSEEIYKSAIAFVSDQTEKLWKKATKSSSADWALLSGVDIFDAINTRYPSEKSSQNTIRLYPHSSDPLEIDFNLYKKVAASHISWQILVDLHHGQGNKNSPEEEGLKPLDIFASEQFSETLLYLFVAYVQQKNLGKTSREVESYLEKHTLNFPEINANPQAAHIEIPTPWKGAAFSTPKNWKISPFKAPLTISLEQMKQTEDSFRGIASADVNNDSYPDIFIAHEGSDSKLYLNLQGDGFQDVTQISGLAKYRGVTTAHFADFNNDGCRDLLIIRPYDGPVLLQNTCKGQFIDVTVKSRLQTSQHVTEALWLDLNSDGLLDVILITSARSSERKSSNLVFIQNKKNIFEESAKKFALDQPMNSIAALFTDLNQDGLIDLFFINDLEDNIAYTQTSKGKFINSTVQLKIPSSHHSRSAAMGDINGDQKSDLYITNIKASQRDQSKTTNQLLISKEIGFENLYEKWFPKSIKSQWASNHLFFDSANRGLLDLLILNGHRPDSLIGHDEENTLAFQNPNNQSFDPLAANQSGLSAENNSRAAIAVDLDLNGSLDLVVNGLHQPIVYKNTLDTKNQNWLRLELIGSRSNRDAIGARVKLMTSKSTQTQLYGSIGGAYLGHNHAPLHFGLNDISAIDRIEIIWPSGQKQTLINVETNQSLQLTEPL